jgi:hypothetical protein
MLKAKKSAIIGRKRAKSRFGQMLCLAACPATQISTKYDGNIFQYLTDVVRAIGGTNSSTYIIFYLMIAAFIGLRGMGVNHWLSTIGGFAYGYSGFFIIGYAAGHNAKVNTAAFIPLMILALLLVFEKKNWRAFILMTVFAGLSIHRNHFQITYYAGIFMAIIWVVYLIQYAKEKALPAFAKYTGLVALGRRTRHRPKHCQYLVYEGLYLRKYAWR